MTDPTTRYPRLGKAPDPATSRHRCARRPARKWRRSLPYPRGVTWPTSPFLIVVSGIPGAGKSTVGRAIADRLNATLLDKDDFLETLFETDHGQRDELSRRADELFLEAVAQQPQAVAVSFWRRSELSENSGTPIDRFPAGRQIVEVWCDCPVDVAHRRFFSRSRHASHRDEERDRADTLDQLRQVAALGPLGLGRLVRVDTTEPPDADALIGSLALG